MRTIIINVMDKKNSCRDEFPALNARQISALRPRLDSGKLFGGAREVVIEHAGQEYLLRVTSQGKLILTK
jgi:hemin uptake protein HemP